MQSKVQERGTYTELIGKRWNSMSVVYNPDPHALYEIHICDICGEVITDVYYEVYDEEICEECMNENRRYV